MHLIVPNYNIKIQSIRIHIRIQRSECDRRCPLLRWEVIYTLSVDLFAVDVNVLLNPVVWKCLEWRMDVSAWLIVSFLSKPNAVIIPGTIAPPLTQQPQNLTARLCKSWQPLSHYVTMLIIIIQHLLITLGAGVLKLKLVRLELCRRKSQGCLPLGKLSRFDRLARRLQITWGVTEHVNLQAFSRTLSDFFRNHPM